MASISGFIFYIFIFLSVYAQVFFLVTFFENKDKIVVRNHKIRLKRYPKVTIIVPCWNEEKTVYKTIRSLMALNYPKNKLELFLVDDGSTDGTWNVLNKFSHYANIKLFKKENGGKYTALNLGLEQSNSNFIGCLDADSLVHEEALVRIMGYFEANPEIMAVVPSVTVMGARNFIQKAQKAEYYMGVYMKKMFDFLGAINVTPGPFTIFNKKVFNDLGPYKHAHNTEDMEIAYRMQRNRYEITHCHDAYVYTNTPANIYKLYRQRLRWIYGFINNTIDYRDVIFKRKYGNFALFTLPTGIVSIFSVGYLFGKVVYNIVHFMYFKIVSIQTLGFGVGSLSFDLFFVNYQTSMFLVFLMYCVIFFAILFGSRISEGKWTFSLDMLFFFPVFSVIAPFWIMKALYNTLLSRGAPAWR